MMMNDHQTSARHQKPSAAATTRTSTGGLPTPRRTLLRLLRVWSLAVVVFGFGLALTYAWFSWLLNEEQKRWMLWMHVVALPFVGGVCVVALPRRWYRPIHDALSRWTAGGPVDRSECLMVYERALRLPWDVARSAFVAAAIAYAVGIAVVYVGAHLPFIEIVKTLPAIPLVGGMQGAFCYFGTARALQPVLSWCSIQLRHPRPLFRASLEAKFLGTVCVLAIAAVCLLQPAAYKLGQIITERYMGDRALTQLRAAAVRLSFVTRPAERLMVLQDAALGSQGYVFESNVADGSIISAHPRGYRHVAEERFRESDLSRWDREGVWVDRVGQHRVVAFVRSMNPPHLFTSVAFPSDFALPLQQFVRFSWVVAFEVLGIVILLGRYYTRGVTSPLAELTDAARKIAEYGDLSQHVPVATNDELSDVARSFNHMVEELQASKTELEEYTKRLERSTQELSAVNQEMEDVLRVVSHDLRAPLINIQGFSTRLAPVIQDAVDTLQRAQSRCADQALSEHITALRQELQSRCAESLRFISKSVEKMDALLASLLAVSRVGRRADPPQPHDLDAIVDDALATVQHQLKEAAIQVIRHPLPAQVPCRRNEINQVFANLVSNAVNYMGATGIRFIEIGGRDTEGGVECFVRDTGIGIALEDQERVFQMFTRLQAVDVPGEGVGLSYVRKILRAHGGRIWVVSQRGQGSTFYFTLPRHQQRTAEG
ncbi:MAG: HAMP domain-containing histidine kinase [Candidatus Omnitrophica bacterium]|nr:HAMP domain-containing histidine kinase [Candidatus Omnitrophota bacterium]